MLLMLSIFRVTCEISRARLDGLSAELYPQGASVLLTKKKKYAIWLNLQQKRKIKDFARVYYRQWCQPLDRVRIRKTSGGQQWWHVCYIITRWLCEQQQLYIQCAPGDDDNIQEQCNARKWILFFFKGTRIIKPQVENMCVSSHDNCNNYIYNYFSSSIFCKRYNILILGVSRETNYLFLNFAAYCVCEYKEARYINARDNDRRRKKKKIIDLSNVTRGN